MSWIVLLLGCAVVAAIGAVVARATLRRATDRSVGGRPSLFFRVAYAEMAALDDGAEGVRRTTALVVALVVGQLVAVAAFGLAVRILAGAVDEPLTDAFADLGGTPLDGVTSTLASPGFVLGVGAAAALLLTLIWPRSRWIPAVVLAGVALLGWADLALLGAIADDASAPAGGVTRVVAGYGTVLLLTLAGLRLRRLRGIPVAVGTGLWLAFAVLAWAVAFGDLTEGRETTGAVGTGLVLGAWLLLTGATVALRHSGLAQTETVARARIGRPLVKG